MLAIRLQRIGKKHQPGFRVVVAERRSKLGGPPVEDLGSYNPKTKTIVTNKDRVSYWLQSGAKASVTLHNLFVKAGIVAGSKIAVKIRRKAVAEAPAAPTVEQAAVQAAPAAETAEAVEAIAVESSGEAAASAEEAAAVQEEPEKAVP